MSKPNCKVQFLMLEKDSIINYTHVDLPLKKEKRKKKDCPWKSDVSCIMKLSRLKQEWGLISCRTGCVDKL